jgi:hypothetical protein
MPPRLPSPRGPISEALLAHLVRRPGTIPPLLAPAPEPLDGDDSQLSLHVLYALHYEGFAGVDPGWEWEPSLLGVRRTLEGEFRAVLEEEVAVPAGARDGSIAEGLRTVIASGGGPSLSRFVADDATIEQLRELLVHRSIYQLKEADGHTFAIPRVRGVAKSAMVRIQTDEYGEGRPGRSHAELFGATMEAVGLDPTPGAHIDLVPGCLLATDNLVSLFGLHRSTMAELIGHLALFEMTSVVPMARYATGIRRLTGSDAAAEFYDVHVVADEVHARWAADEMAEGFVSDHPEMFDGVLFGAAALMHLEAAFTAHVLGRWGTGLTSLRPADSGDAFGAICTETVPRRLERSGVRSLGAPIRVSTGTDVP